MKILPLALVVLCLAACDTPTKAPDGEYLRTDIFEDIPAPRSAMYVHDHQESFAYSSDSYRCGKFIFRYEGSQADAVRFFKETMTSPPYNWKLTKEEQVARGSTVLAFLKNDDHCTVNLDRVPRPKQAQPHNVDITVRVNYRK